jgi:hypothetical protein
VDGGVNVQPQRYETVKRRLFKDIASITPMQGLGSTPTAGMTTLADAPNKALCQTAKLREPLGDIR